MDGARHVAAQAVDVTGQLAGRTFGWGRTLRCVRRVGLLFRLALPAADVGLAAGGLWHTLAHEQQGQMGAKTLMKGILPEPHGQPCSTRPIPLLAEPRFRRGP